MSFQILALSGGGFLGLYTAAVLQEIEDVAGVPLAQCFDLIAGTSVGGIIALGLAKEVPSKEICEAFVENGPKIFSKKNPPKSYLKKKAQLLGNASHARYTSGPLRELIENILGKETTIGKLRHRIIIPAVNLSKGNPQVFKTAHHPSFARDWKLKLVDVALATSAAPTYFPLHRISGELFADGGLYANAPDHLALHEAEYFLGKQLKDVSILSIGTTTTQFSFSNSIGTNLGWLGWMDKQRLPNVMIATQQMNVDYMMRHRLGDRYLRIDRNQSCEQEESLALDVASESAINDLKALAEASVREHLGKGSLLSMLKHRAPEAKFFYNGT